MARRAIATGSATWYLLFVVIASTALSPLPGQPPDEPNDDEPETHVVRVEVVDSGGEPVYDASYTFTQGETTHSRRTNDNGVATFAFAVAGECTIEVTHRSYEAASLTFTVPAEAHPRLTLTKIPTWPVTVRIVDDNSKPLPRVRVTLSQQKETLWEHTDDTGSATFQEVFAGECSMRVSPPSHESATRFFDVPKDTRIEITLRRSTAWIVDVRTEDGSPVRHLQFYASKPGQANRYSVRHKDTGAGYRLAIPSRWSNTHLDLHAYVQGYLGVVVTHPAPQPGEERKLDPIIVPRGDSLRVTVEDADGDSVERATVYVDSLGAPKRAQLAGRVVICHTGWKSIEGEEHATIQGLLPGRYEVSVVASNRISARVGAVVAVHADESNTVELQLPPVAPYEGIVHAGGVPVEGIEVSLWIPTRNRRSESSGYTEKTDVDGRFRFARVQTIGRMRLAVGDSMHAHREIFAELSELPREFDLGVPTTASLIVETAAGKPAPEGDYDLQWRTPGGDWISRQRTGTPPLKIDEIPVGPGEFRVLLRGYAPTPWTRATVTADVVNKVQVDLVQLPPAVTRTITVVDTAGTPIAGVRVSVEHEKERWTTLEPHRDMFAFATDEDVDAPQKTNEAGEVTVAYWPAAIPLFTVDEGTTGYHRRTLRALDDTEGRFVVPRLGQLAVEVQDADGHTATEAQVRIYAFDENGDYPPAVAGKVPSRRVPARAVSYEVTAPGIEIDDYVPVGEGAEVSHIVTLPSLVPVSGRVVISEQPVTDGELRFWARNQEGTQHRSAEARVGRYGRFSTQLRGGGEWFVSYTSAFGNDYNFRVHVGVNGEADLELAVSPTLHRVRFVDEDDNPLVGRYVNLRQWRAPGAMQGLTLRTDATGYVPQLLLLSARCVWSIDDAGRRTVARGSFTVVGDESVVRVRPAGKLHFEVSDNDLIDKEPCYLATYHREVRSFGSGFYDRLPWPEASRVTASTPVPVPRGDAVLYIFAPRGQQVAIARSPFAAADAPESAKLIATLSAAGRIAAVTRWTRIVEATHIDGTNRLPLTGAQLDLMEQVPVGEWRIVGEHRGLPFDETLLLEAGDTVHFGHEIEHTNLPTGKGTVRAYGSSDSKTGQ